MSIPLELTRLPDVVARYRFAYLLTTTANGAPRAVAVSAALEGEELVVSGFGRHTRENLSVRSVVGLIWPPQSESDYTLIVDGSAKLSGESLRITPARAVLHRPAPSPHPRESGCAADCIELD